MLDDLRERLLHEGVKPGVVGRYVAELEDHLEDLDEAGSRDEALRRLGAPDVLAAAMLSQPGVLSWTARAPWATLTVGPLLALLLGWLLPTLALFLSVRAFAADLDYGRAATSGTWPYTALWFIFGFAEHLLPILIGWAAIAIALRQRAGWGWLLPGVLLTAILGGGLIMAVDWQVGNPATVRFGIGFDFADPFTTMLGRSVETGIFNLVVILTPYSVLRKRIARSA